ncbi:MAG: hypothetical protein AB8G11_21160 [Saprospiraceae bacterium]
MKIFTTLLLSLFCTVITFAQTSPFSENEIDMTQSVAKGTAVIGAFGEVVKVESLMKESSINGGIYKRPTYFSEDFTGYTIQLTTSMERLADDNALFGEFGDLMIEENTNPKYCYMMGDFRTKDGAEKFLETVILYRYPEAKVLRYKKGKRKKLK